MNRRNFIFKTSGAAAGLLTLPYMLKSCSIVPSTLSEVGIITNTINAPLKKDWKATLETLSSWGYKYLEHGQAYGDSPSGFKEFMKSIGMKSLAGGTTLAELLPERSLMKQINNCHELDKKYLVCYWPWLKSLDDIVFEDIEIITASLNRLGKKCKEEGLKFAFHNHDKEFTEINNSIIYDFILQNTDPEHVVMEADMYWMVKGGADPVEYFTKYPGRFEIIHMKDMNNETEKDFACVGSGVIDFQRIVDNADTAGIKYLIVEHDHPVNHMECAKSSIDHILSLNL